MLSADDDAICVRLLAPRRELTNSARDATIFGDMRQRTRTGAQDECLPITKLKLQLAARRQYVRR